MSDTTGSPAERLTQWIALCEQSSATGEATEIMEEAIATIERLEALVESFDAVDTARRADVDRLEAMIVYMAWKFDSGNLGIPIDRVTITRKEWAALQEKGDE